METKTILEQIGKLPIEDKMLIVERTIKSIREKELKEKMFHAVSELEQVYKTNKELCSRLFSSKVNFRTKVCQLYRHY